MDTPQSEESTLTAAGKAIQGLVLEHLSQGMVVFALVLLGYGAIEATGAARVVAVSVGALGVVLPFVGWRRHWSDVSTWLLLLPMSVAIMGAFVWAARG